MGHKQPFTMVRRMQFVVWLWHGLCGVVAHAEVQEGLQQDFIAFIPSTAL
jgi:hypothetical protein